MNLEELTKLANDFLLKEYHLDLKIPIEISSRMKKSLGAFVIRNNVAYKIKISKNLINYYNQEIIVDVLYHECIHYALFTLKRPYKDGEAYFKNELKRLGVSESHTYVYKGIVHYYQCPNCNIIFERKMKGYERRYYCAVCNGKFKYLGERIKI